MDLFATGATRRELLGSLALGTASAPLLRQHLSPMRALAFDAFVLFDPTPIVERAKILVGEKGGALFATASTKLFSYTWLYTSAGRYDGFEVLARDAFRSAADVHGAMLKVSEVDSLVATYSMLPLWPDVTAAILRLRERNLRLAVLANLPKRWLVSNLRANRIEGHFEHVLSTDEVRRFKPAPEAYAMAMDKLRLSARSIGFAASAGWDASGAVWFGYRTAWVNRNNSPREPAHAPPDIVSRGMDGVLRLAGVDG